MNKKNFILHLNSRKIRYYIVTSKGRKKTKQFSHKYKIFQKKIHCPSIKFKGKPRPDLINYCIKINHFDKKKCFYLRDTEHDYLAAKSAKVRFIFANYGYGEKKRKYKLAINNPNQLFDFI